MTPKQKQLLSYIDKHVRENDGVAPSFDEMKLAMGLASKSGVHRLISALRAQGMVTMMPNMARTVAPTKAGKAALAGKMVAPRYDNHFSARIAEKLEGEAHRFRLHSGESALNEMAARLREGTL